MTDTLIPASCRQVGCPCRHFQTNWSATSPVPIGFCWKRSLEVAFNREPCEGCPDFVCGLFDPKRLVLLEDVDGLIAIYNSVAAAVVSGEGESPYTFEVWSVFRQKVEIWHRQASASKRKFTASPAVELLSGSAADLQPAKHGLLPVEDDESVYGYFLRVYPPKYHKSNEAARKTVDDFAIALGRLIEEKKCDLLLESVLSKARELRKAGRSPDSL
ncbi:MAG: hypothetical protein WCG99_03340 [Candidatus Berkelbacteria bacterium]